MKQIAVAFTIALLLVGLALPVVVTQVDAASGIPTFSVVSVAPGEKVTIQTDNFPANKTFLVLIGEYGTLGKGGTPITTIESGKGGAFQATFTLPEALKKNEKLAIRLESTKGGFYAFNWFDNPVSGCKNTTPAPTYNPSVTFTSVEVGVKVTLKASGFPAETEVKVLMGKFGTMGVGGTEVSTFSSGKGGSVSITVNIPASFKDTTPIAIRIESTKGGYYAYNWFNNK